MTLLDAPARDATAANDDLLDRGRAAVGVDGADVKEPLLPLLRSQGVSLYTVIALGLLAWVDGFQALVIGTLAPEISRGLGIGAAGLSFLVLLRTLAIAAGTVLFAHIVGKRAIRGAIAIGSAIGWSLATVFTGLVRTPAQLGLVNTVDGIATGAVSSVHIPLLFDHYPPAVRVRIVAMRTSFLQASGLVSPLLVLLLVGPLHLTWRGCLLMLGGLAVLVSLVGLGLRDPGYGHWDTERVKELVHADGAVPVSADPALGFFESARLLWLIPTVRKLLVATVLGSLGTSANIYFAFFLAEDFGLGPTGRTVFGIAEAVITILLLPVLAPFGDRMFRRDPATLIRLMMSINLAAVIVTLVGLASPWLPLLLICQATASTVPNALSPALSTTVMNVVPARTRSHLIGLITIVGVGVGGTAGVLLLSGLDQRIGLRAALIVLTLTSLPGILVLFSASKTINDDLNATVGRVLEQEELAVLHHSGVHAPLLACRGIDFSYGQLQVLFGVDFTVDDGEMVALLGTNGAGKSTLLGVVSGLNLPSRGSVRLNGADITYIDTERRVGMGISQVMGGRAVFGPLSVAENLRLFGFTHGRDRTSIERGIEESFAAFPRLAERRNQPAMTLSGGEQQMLGLSQALILRPRLLCIDELSLGLAPKVVGELLEMVRTINALGTAVVLVEQSATIALSLVDHAYFMERGQIRFDGAADDLLGRDDLLRSVFLQGTGAALGKSERTR